LNFHIFTLNFTWIPSSRKALRNDLQRQTDPGGRIAFLEASQGQIILSVIDKLPKDKLYRFQYESEFTPSHPQSSNSNLPFCPILPVHQVASMQLQKSLLIYFVSPTIDLTRHSVFIY